MTVCIAAICEKGKKAIVVSDRMITAADTEFEQEMPKIEKLTECCAAVSAGTALARTEIFDSVIDEISKITSPKIAEVTECVKSHFVKLRIRRAEEESFKPLGITVEEFLKRQKDFDDSIVMRLTRSLEQARLHLRIIIVGVDKAGAHIYYIRDPGTSEVFDSIGYCAIGSGDRHAEGSLIDNDYTTSWPLKRALYFVYEAKRRAEKAPGVGQKFTDIVTVSEGRWNMLTERELKQLNTIFQKKNELQVDVQKSLESLINGLAVY